MKDLLQNKQLVVTLGLLYLAQGIPMGVAMDALPTFLRHDGSELSVLAFLPLVGLPWVIKFLWAPFVDNHWGKTLGRRKSWIIPMQVVVTVSMFSLSVIGFSVENAIACVALLCLSSLASATQDIATDGMAAEQVNSAMLSKINAIQIAGVMAGFFIGGAGLMMMSDSLGQHMSLAILACVPLLSLLFIAVCPLKKTQTSVVAEKASLLNTFKRRGAPRLLLLTLLSAVTAVSGFGLAKLFLNDAGWSLAEIGKMGMAGGMVTLILGCGGGAWLIGKIGVWRAFSFGLLFALLSSLLWMVQSVNGVMMGLVATCIVLGSLSAGITSVAIMTAGMQFASRYHQAGTDMTAVQSTRDIGELASSMMLVGLTAAIGYSGGFMLGAGIAFVALLVTFSHYRYMQRLETEEAA
ncbi:RhtX/FptX family siderophore transporter [Providencia vermicola]|uniref:RhtX/FptX family siderophore transporter n=1 Tax=Providencia TaxID=586 RepID=UPI0012B5082B|nr:MULTISPECIES: RhtX/FptX family siderophore transporter [unclassified Providencia]MTB39529.1 RhtX/FptX family siderophore transporter [Providencia sp. wls1949]MTC07506.1 RhtX/FptX family siderophore transporter [Providencia sp. wls1948]